MRNPGILLLSRPSILPGAESDRAWSYNYTDALRRQIGKKAKKNADHYSDPLDPIASRATPLASVVHVRQAIMVSRTHIPSPQGPLGDTKIDLSHRCTICTMGEVELSSALAPLSRCRIASPLAGMLTRA